VFVVVSHCRANLVAVQFAAVRHWTQRIVVVLQTGAKPPVHWVLLVHVSTHVLVLVSQA